MLIAHYIGSAKPGILAKIGWHLIVLGQKPPYDLATHTEAIHAVNLDGTVTIASSSLHDKGVRVKKNVRLTKGNWCITDVPVFELQKSIDWFAEAVKVGMPYDKLGALATMLPGKQSSDKVFCTEAVLAPFIKDSHYFTPAEGMAICLGLGRDVTDEFFLGVE